MADINFAGFNPRIIAEFKKLGIGKDFEKLGIGKGFNKPFASPLTQPTADTQINPYAALATQYGQKPIDVSKLSLPAQETFAMFQGFQGNPAQTLLIAQIQDIQAQKANEMARENLKLAEEASVRKQGRQFTMDQASRLFESIPRAFGAIPFEATQEVTANIANLVSPRNLNPQPQLQPAAFSMPARQYFR